MARPTHRRGSATVVLHCPDTDDAYEIGCDWFYSFYPGDYDSPDEVEFETRNHQLLSINGENTKQELPDWIDWEEFDNLIYNKEI